MGKHGTEMQGKLRILINPYYFHHTKVFDLHLKLSLNLR